MNLASFLAYTAVGTGLWSAFLAYLGYFLGRNFTKVGEYLDPLSWVVLAGISALYVLRVVRHKGAGKPRNRRGS